MERKHTHKKTNQTSPIKVNLSAVPRISSYQELIIVVTSMETVIDDYNEDTARNSQIQYKLSAIKEFRGTHSLSEKQQSVIDLTINSITAGWGAYMNAQPVLKITEARDFDQIVSDAVSNLAQGENL